MMRPASAAGIVAAQTELIYVCRNFDICTVSQTMQSYCDYYTGVGSAVRHDSTGDAADFYRLYFSCWQPYSNPPAWWSYPSQPAGTPKVTCPSNSTGTTTCTCNEPYVPDASGTSCVTQQEKYTLELEQALKETNPVASVEPTNRKNISVRVKDSNGTPMDGFRVSLKVDVESNTGGHDHDTQRPKGTLSGSPCDTPESSCATATTDPSGYASFTFTAPAFSGTHTFVATCVSPACSNTANGKINVKVDGLEQIPDSSIYVLIKKPKATHSKGHFLTPEALNVLQDIAVSYYSEYRFLQRKLGNWSPLNLSGMQLYLNDASLIWGGRFDFRGNWSSPHGMHRRGVVIDVRANNNTGAIPLSSFYDFAKMTASKQNSVNGMRADAQIHCTSNKTDGQNRKPPTCVGDDGSQDTNRHFHILLLGVDQ